MHLAKFVSVSFKSTMDLNDLNKVWEVKPLKKVREDEAKEILEKIAKQVQPIMRKHKWKVNILSEFWYLQSLMMSLLHFFIYVFCFHNKISTCSPPNPALLGLNINGGAEVKLRLRRQNNEWDFFPYEQILDTMLHELCHNQYGPHNADFYNLLDEIRKVKSLSLLCCSYPNLSIFHTTYRNVKN